MSRVVLEGLMRVAKRRLAKSPRHVAIAALMRASAILVVHGEMTPRENKRFVLFLARETGMLPGRKKATKKRATKVKGGRR